MCKNIDRVVALFSVAMLLILLNPSKSHCSYTWPFSKGSSFKYGLNSAFGYRKLGSTYEFHRGLDIDEDDNSNTNDEAYATFSGTVHARSATHIIIKENDSHYMRFYHLNTENLGIGSSVVGASTKLGECNSDHLDVKDYTGNPDNNSNLRNPMNIFPYSDNESGMQISNRGIVGGYVTFDLTVPGDELDLNSAEVQANFSEPPWSVWKFFDYDAGINVSYSYSSSSPPEQGGITIQPESFGGYPYNNQEIHFTYLFDHDVTDATINVYNIDGDLEATDYGVGIEPDLDVTITSPQQGNVWYADETHDISWEIYHYGGATIDRVELYYSTNTEWPSEYITTINNPDPGTEWIDSTSWTIPKVSSPYCEVRVRAYDSHGNYKDDISGSFTIRADWEADVVSPEWGETWHGENQESIEWYVTEMGISEQKVYFSTHSYSPPWDLICSYGQANPGTFTHLWTIPDTIDSYTCVIKVEAQGTYQGSNVRACGFSAPFTIEPTPPAAPTGLHAWCESAAFPGFVTINLAWNSNSESDLEGYNVYHQSDGGNWGLLKTTTDTTASQVVRYETVHYYYVTAFDLAGNESDGSDTIRVVARPEASPFVFGWDGSEFVIDNSILPACEIVSEVNTDYYKIERHLKKQNNRYLLQIMEFGNDHTYLDQVKLLAVDHPAELSIGTTSDGEIIAYEETASPIFCEDNYGNDWLDSVKTVGDGYYSSEDGDWLDLDFGEVGWEERAVIVGTWMAAKFALHVQMQEGDEWEDVGIIYPRAMYSNTLVNLSEFSFDGKLRIYCEGNAIIDYVALTEPEMRHVKIRKCPLKFAIHSEEGSVKHELLNIDENYAEIMPGDTINLAFNAMGRKHSHVRDFVLVSTGYYTDIEGAGGTMSAGNVRLAPTFKLSGYPNPFKAEIEISFALPKEADVSLKVYDISGKLIKTIVNGRTTSGYYSVNWDAKDLPSGIYFVKLQAGEFTDTRKLVLMK